MFVSAGNDLVSPSMGFEETILERTEADVCVAGLVDSNSGCRMLVRMGLLEKARVRCSCSSSRDWYLLII